MKKLGVLLIVCMMILAACSSKQTSEENKAATKGSEQNVVAGTMVITNILDKLEVDSVVGVPTTTEKMPARYKEVTEIGNAMSPDMEIVKSLNPDQFISVTTLAYDLKEGFKQAKIDTEFVDLQSVDAMQKSILSLGKQFDRQQQAEKLSATFDQAINEAKKNATGKHKPKVLALLGVPGSYLVAGENSYIGDLISIAGGENAIQGPSEEYLSSNTEYLQQSNPDIIVRLAHGMPEEVVEMFDEEFKTNDIWKHFDAVKNNRVYDLDSKLFGTTANLEVADAIKQLQEFFYEQ